MAAAVVVQSAGGAPQDIGRVAALTARWTGWGVYEPDVGGRAIGPPALLLLEPDTTEDRADGWDGLLPLPVYLNGPGPGRRL